MNDTTALARVTSFSCSYGSPRLGIGPRASFDAFLTLAEGDSHDFFSRAF